MKRILFEDMDMYYNKYNANMAARDLKPPTYTIQDLLNYFTSQYPNVVRAPKQAPAPVINNDTKILDIYNLLVDYRSNMKASLGNPMVTKNKDIRRLAHKIIQILDETINNIKKVDKLARHYKI